MLKMQKSICQNQNHLGGVTGNLGSPSGFPVNNKCVKLLKKLTYIIV